MSSGSNMIFAMELMFSFILVCLMQEGIPTPFKLLRGPEPGALGVNFVLFLAGCKIKDDSRDGVLATPRRAGKLEQVDLHRPLGLEVSTV